jgi:hypothetical protein
MRAAGKGAEGAARAAGTPPAAPAQNGSPANATHLLRAEEGINVPHIVCHCCRLVRIPQVCIELGGREGPLVHARADNGAGSRRGRRAAIANVAQRATHAWRGRQSHWGLPCCHARILLRAAGIAEEAAHLQSAGGGGGANVRGEALAQWEGSARERGPKFARMAQRTVGSRERTHC